MVASPTNESESDEDVIGSMSELLATVREATPAEKRLQNATPGASFFMKFMLAPLLLLFAGPLVMLNSGLMSSGNGIDISELCRSDPNLPCDGVRGGYGVTPLSADGRLESDNDW
eukprot:CAMPEP_0179471612 /NCGR_PEP_ID=MMETSP0799-20121207/51799_1 /TAXON_ID=46947 /ORGANISM="Geminigera cryophila, Strain CCMP2564" /LENGTH=114 /DNA_ID=CAMNT_0021279311 /DNA_START=44 /DNA_END=385 /DNA_ORIENTATION=-